MKSSFLILTEKRLFRKKHATLRKPKKNTKKSVKNSAEDSNNKRSSIDSSVSVGVMLPHQQDSARSNGESTLASSVVQATSLVISTTVLSEGW